MSVTDKTGCSAAARFTRVTDDRGRSTATMPSRDKAFDPLNMRCRECGRSGFRWWQMHRWRSPERMRCQACYERARRRKKREARPLIACDHCGESFKPTRSDARFCSDRCRQRAHRGSVR